MMIELIVFHSFGNVFKKMNIPNFLSKFSKKPIFFRSSQQKDKSLNGFSSLIKLEKLCTFWLLS